MLSLCPSRRLCHVRDKPHSLPAPGPWTTPGERARRHVLRVVASAGAAGVRLPSGGGLADSQPHSAPLSNGDFMDICKTPPLLCLPRTRPNSSCRGAIHQTREGRFAQTFLKTDWQTSYWLLVQNLFLKSVFVVHGSPRMGLLHPGWVTYCSTAVDSVLSGHPFIPMSPLWCPHCNLPSS